MCKKEVFINKKTMYISMNASLVLSFIFFFLMLGNTSFAKKYSFIGTISDFAKTSETKTFNVTVSSNSKEQYQELLTFNNANINNPDVYSNSMIATPNENNKLELVLEKNKITPAVFTLRTLFSYKQSESDDAFKLESDDIYVDRTDDSAPPGVKTVAITKSIAEKIANSIGKTDPASALGQELLFNYVDYALERVSVPVFVKGIVVDDAGIIANYKINYGDDLIFLASNAYDYNVLGSRLDIRYSQSIYRNLIHTDALIGEFGVDRLSFSNNNFLSTFQIENLSTGYQDSFIQNKIWESPLFIAFLVLFLLSVSLTVLCLVLYFKKYNKAGHKHNFISIMPFWILLVIFYTFTTIMNFIMKDDATSGAYLTAPRSIVFLVFLVIGVIITFLPSQNKGIEVDEENKN